MSRSILILLSYPEDVSIYRRTASRQQRNIFNLQKIEVSDYLCDCDSPTHDKRVTLIDWQSVVHVLKFE